MEKKVNERGTRREKSSKKEMKQELNEVKREEIKQTREGRKG